MFARTGCQACFSQCMLWKYFVDGGGLVDMFARTGCRACFPPGR